MNIEKGIHFSLIYCNIFVSWTMRDLLSAILANNGML